MKNLNTEAQRNRVAQSETMLTIRPADIEDVADITEIYNDAIVNTTATFDTEQKTVESQEEWFRHHDANHPVIVAEKENRILGWASLTRWSDRCAYNGTAEVSVYVHKNFRGQGIGKKLVEVLIAEGEKAGLHTLISRISEGNGNSIHIHEIFGFEHIGVMKQVGHKFGKYLDVHLMQKVFM